MKPRPTILHLLGIAVATSVTAGIAAADQQPSEMAGQKTSASATVQKTDPKKREMTVKDEQGNSFIVHVPEEVTRFEAVKPGDQIKLDYYESVALSLKKSSEPGAQPSAIEESTTERAPGALPSGVVRHKITATAEVVKVDRANNKVTIRGPNGEIDTINVSDPALQSQLGQLKKGDRIQASYTEAMAVTVTPKAKE
jgi:Cu/Ag efflux protein CusF